MEITELYKKIFNLKEEAFQENFENNSEYNRGYIKALNTILSIVEKEYPDINKTTPKKCSYCGKSFIPKTSSQKFCCKKCRENILEQSKI